MIKIYLLLVISFYLFTGNTFSQEFTCKIKGTVIGRNSKEILLTPVTEDLNSVMLQLKGIIIPIKGGKFEYALKVSHIQGYRLIFSEEVEAGGFVVKEFFPDTSEVEIKLYPDEEYQKNSYKGGELNRLKNESLKSLYTKLDQYQKTRDSLVRVRHFYTSEYQVLSEKMELAENQKEKMKLASERGLLIKANSRYTPEALLVIGKQDSIYKEQNEWEKRYFQKNRNLYSYSLLYNLAANTTLNADINLINSVFPAYKEKYPLHPYTKKIWEIINARKRIRVGGSFIDFSAPTLDNKVVKLSDSIKGKVALLDLWASWCGSCRFKSRSMIPIYEKFRSKGFVVVGVANEFKNTNAFKLAIEKDKYPWLNLVELNSQNGIWRKYGIEGSGGATYLLDSSGKIVAINANEKEVERLLNELLE